MTLEETRSVVEGYLADRGGHWLAEDVELELADSERRAGRREVARLLERLCAGRAAELTFADGRAVVEWAGGRAAVFEVEAGEIVRTRVYQGSPKEDATPRQGPLLTIEANHEGGAHVQ